MFGSSTGWRTVQNVVAKDKGERSRFQIYTMQTVEEARAVVALGVNHVGITPSNLGLPSEVDYDMARAIVEGEGTNCAKI